ncbi:MAG: hypothetical protein JWQ35_2569 [Bacteriovoracaceae bacterium]|nr:hypothetical protein [Bacteriovoracaceae bacterium]
MKQMIILASLVVAMVSFAGVQNVSAKGVKCVVTGTDGKTKKSHEKDEAACTAKGGTVVTKKGK